MKIQFVRDEASGDDFFGGHGNIAATLVDLIDHPDRLRLIGLLGSWGSGKSTVIKIASNELRKPNRNPECVVFTFDAWMHQSDPPRRAFIESFIQFLIQEKLDPNETFEDELADVQRRIETHEINSTPTLSPWGIGIAVSLLLLPLGIRLSGEEGWIQAFGWPLVAMPFAIAAANWWCWRKIRNPLNAAAFFSRANLSKNRPPFENRSITSILVNKSTDKTTNRILKTPEPTSIEFRRNFASIISKVSNSKYKFVFILDNLDRIPPEDALNIWSTFRSLFSGLENREENADLNFCVIIPLDYFSLQKLYPLAGATSAENAERVQSLIDKSFDIVLRVGPPVQSDWSNYLEKQLRYATFNKVDDNQLYDAKTLYRSYLEHKQRTSRVTPRDINAYVNGIAIILAQRKQEVSFVSACYYACFSAQGEEFNISAILTSEAPALSVVSRLDKDWRTGVSAIHFGVAPEKALQLLVGDEVVSAIMREDEDDFKKLVSIPGFEGVLEQLLRSGEGRLPSFYAALAAMLPDLEAATVTVSKIWDIVISHLTPVAGWDRLSSLTAKGIARAVSRQGKALGDSLVVSLSVDTPEFEQPPQVWLQNVNAVVEVAGIENLQLANLAVPFNAEYYLETLRAAETESLGKTIFEALRPSAAREEVISELATTLRTNSFDKEDIADVGRLIRVAGPWPWDGVLEVCKEVIADSEDIDPVTGALTILVQLGSRLGDALGEIGRKGHLADAFYQAWQNGDEADLAAVLGAIIIGWPELVIEAHVEDSQAGEQLLRDLDGLDDAAKERINEGVLAEIRKFPADTLLGLAKWALAHPNSGGTLYAAGRSAIAAGLASSVHTVKMAEIAGRLVETGDRNAMAIVRHSAFAMFWKSADKSLDPHQIAKVGLEVGISNIPAEGVAAITKKISDKDENFWIDAIQNRPEILKIADKLLEFGHALELGGGLRRAYNSYFTSLAGGAFSSVSLGISWPRLLAASEDSGKEAIIGLLDLVATIDNESKMRVLQGFEADFLSEKIVIELGDKIASVLILPLLIDDDDDIPSSVLDSAELIAPIAKKFRKATRVELKEKLEKLVEREVVTSDRRVEVEALWNLNQPARKARATKPRSPRRQPKKGS